MVPISANGKKIDRRVIKTRKAIMGAYERLIGQGNPGKITVSAIAREADIDRKTFYLHYDSVNALADQKAEECIERLLAAVKREGRGKSRTEQLHILLQELNALLMEDVTLYGNIAAHISTDQILELFCQASQPALLHMGITLDTEGNPPIRQRLLFYIAGTWAIYSAWLRSDRSQPIEEVAAIVESAIKEPDAAYWPASLQPKGD